MNWLVKLKNGDYSLAVTFWIFNFLFGVAIAVISEILIYTPIYIIPVWMRWLYIISVWVYNPILLIGIWRSATKYEGRFIWAALAKIVAVCGIVFYLYSLCMFFD